MSKDDHSMVTIARQALALCKCGTSGQGQELCGVDLTNSEAIRSETPGLRGPGVSITDVQDK